MKIELYLAPTIKNVTMVNFSKNHQGISMAVITIITPNMFKNGKPDKVDVKRIMCSDISAIVP